MRCLSCKYDLSHLTEHRCPECGREFDPSNSRTFDDPERAKKKRKRTELLVFVALLTFLLVSAVISADQRYESGEYAKMWLWISAAGLAGILVALSLFVYLRESISDHS